MRIAVFDLDGTITRHDTFLPYLRGWLERHPRAGFWGLALAALLGYPFRPDPGQLKSRLLRAAMGGAAREAVERWSAAYVGALGDAELCPGALAAIARERAAAGRLVLLSASIDLYVPEIGRRFGFDEVVCTEVAWRGGVLDGALATPNRRAGEKRRCIEALRARHPGARLAAYANARSDFEHFAAADEAVLVNAGPALQRSAARRGYRCEEWRNKPAA
jgi:HAD superfamily phosphoserine phosphatase-like hydrolase